jgi:NAD(P)-dependent dehydrogenase (short-subunit alcohol dehydrogenase family)
MGRLEGKVAVITGGASGMGEATARIFVREGARVVIADLQQEMGEEVARSLGAHCRFVKTDVSSSEDVRSLVVAAVEGFGKLDIMYNNAGIGGGEGSIVDCTEEQFDRIIAVDLKGVWLGMKHCLPYLIQNGGGSIITTASVSAMMGMPGQGAYGSAKGGVVQLTRVCAVENAEKGVRANCICPGGTLTPILYNNPFGQKVDPEVVARGLVNVQPIPRAGLPEDIAHAALWLASDESSFVTGQAIVVDGGWTASARQNYRRPVEA